MTSPQHNYPATRLTNGTPSHRHETLAHEAPLQIYINDTPYITTMRTPGHDTPLATGLLFSENIINEKGLRQANIHSETKEHLDTLTLTLPEIYICDNLRPSRSIISYASCGICGTEKLQQLQTQPLQPKAPFDTARLPQMYADFQKQQTLYKQTGGSHGAALFTNDGTLLTAHEDIGRHNAVDKTIGTLIQKNTLHQAQILLVSGRISFEIILKALHARLPIIAAISAPSTLAIDLAKQYNITVIAFCRENRATIYSHPQHLTY